MPKERVHHGKIWRHKPNVRNSTGDIVGNTVDEYRGESNLEDGEYLTEDPSLEINWDRDHGNVQVSIDFSREQWLACAKDFEETPDLIKKAIYTGSLSRRDINEMIKTLRRARDAAFGRDE